jgi:hypothetical protein
VVFTRLASFIEVDGSKDYRQFLKVYLVRQLCQAILYIFDSS